MADPQMAEPALLVIDVQKAIDHSNWGGNRNNPDAEANIARLLSFWRSRGWPVFHVRHLSREAGSTYRPGQAGCEFKSETGPIPGEIVVDKSANSAFIGTGLEGMLHRAGISRVVITGVITNNSVETTARMAGNLGFETVVVSDATATFGRNDFAGRWRTADEVHSMSLANLEGEYATVLSTAQVLARLAAS